MLTLHNLTFYAGLVREARQAVVEGRYDAWASATLRELAGDPAGEPADDKDVESPG